MSAASHIFLSPRWPVRETVDTVSEVPFQRCPSVNTLLLRPIHFPKRHRCKTDLGMAAAPSACNVALGFIPDCLFQLFHPHWMSLHPSGALSCCPVLLDHPPVCYPESGSMEGSYPHFPAALICVCSLSACSGLLSNP